MIRIGFQQLQSLQVLLPKFRMLLDETRRPAIVTLGKNQRVSH
jgi:hypothetical protein